VLPFFAKLRPCLVGIEACGTSHHWARELTSLGHDVRLMPPVYVKPYVKLCSPAHNLTNHEVPKMRRNAA
jgi:transposase